MFSTSCGNGGLINRHDGAVGMGHQPIEAGGIAASNGSSSRGVNTAVDSAMGGQVLSTSRDNSRLISRHHSTVGVGHQLGIVEGSSVGWCIGELRGSDQRLSNSSSVNASVSSTMGSQMLSASSSHCGLISGHHSTVGVSHQLGIMEGSGVRGTPDVCAGYVVG